MAFDFGLRWVGVAFGQTVTHTATPITTLAARNGKVDPAVLDALVEEWQPTRLIVGLPLNMDQSESEMSAAARRFGRALECATALSVTYVDERLTSRYAEDPQATMRGGTSSPDGNHAEAARLIAQTYLNDLSRSKRSTSD